MNVNAHNLSALGLLTPVLFILCGCWLYYYNYKDPERKKGARLGLVLIGGGTILLVWPFIFGA